MDENIKNELTQIYNALNLVEVHGFANMVNLANSIQALQQIIQRPQEENINEFSD